MLAPLERPRLGVVHEEGLGLAQEKQLQRVVACVGAVAVVCVDVAGLEEPRLVVVVREVVCLVRVAEEQRQAVVVLEFVGEQLAGAVEGARRSCCCTW